MEEKTVMVRVHESTKRILDGLGLKNQSYDSIISALIVHAQHEDNVKRKNTTINDFYQWARKHHFLTRFWIYCFDCKKKRAVQLHHKDHNRENGVIENIGCLCRNCHLKVHGQFNETKYKHSR